MSDVDTEVEESWELFWELVDELRFVDERVAEGTLMGGRCARVAGEFVGLVDRRTGALVVKLPKERVAALIADGEGRSFAPAKKVFSEWVAIPSRDAERWRALLEESIAFVAP